MESSPAPPEPVAPTPEEVESSVAARLEVERLAEEREFWASVKGSGDPAEFRAYLNRYPDGAYAVLAHGRLDRLEETASETEPKAEVVASMESSPAPPEPVVPTPEEVEASLELGRKEWRMVQQGLASLGYEPGPVDGLFGVRTREAIRRYQGEKGFEVTGYLKAQESEALVAVGEEVSRAERNQTKGRSKTLPRRPSG